MCATFTESPSSSIEIEIENALAVQISCRNIGFLQKPFFSSFFSYYSLHWYDICLNMLLISSMVLFFVSGTFLYMKIVKNSCSIAKMMNT